MLMRYTGLAIVLHWLVAVLIFVNFPLGALLEDMKFSPQKLELMSYHKWIGISVLLLMTIRIIWRITHRPPTLPSMPSWQLNMARFVHFSLYLILILIPLTGWMLSSAKGIPVVYFSWWELPDLVAKNKQLAETLAELHEGLNQALLLLLILHIGAVIKHMVLNKDGLLFRMLPIRRT